MPTEQRVPAPPFPDRLTIRRVANGWVIQPGIGTDEITHIAATPDDLAKHISLWAKAQLLTAPPYRGVDHG